jgi:hypothetical protein
VKEKRLNHEKILAFDMKLGLVFLSALPQTIFLKRDLSLHFSFPISFEKYICVMLSSFLTLCAGSLLSLAIVSAAPQVPDLTWPGWCYPEEEWCDRLKICVYWEDYKKVCNGDEKAPSGTLGNKASLLKGGNEFLGRAVSEI